MYTSSSSQCHKDSKFAQNLEVTRGSRIRGLRDFHILFCSHPAFKTCWARGQHTGDSYELTPLS